MDGLLSINDKEFKSITSLVYDTFGINLTEQKRSLVVGRLNKHLKVHGYHSFGAYYEHIIDDKSNRELLTLVDKVSTNHSYFFREKEHFTHLTSAVLPELTAALRGKNSNQIRIWVAGCANGEEPYTISMLLNEYFGAEMVNWDIGILATDISLTALELARQARYPLEKLKEVPVAYKHKYFQLGDGLAHIKDEVKKNILFKRLNLMNDTFPFKDKFHIIFCRNVMIYFDKETRENLVSRFHRYTHPGGMLYIGHSESLDRRTCPFEYVLPSAYQRKN